MVDNILGAYGIDDSINIFNIISILVSVSALFMYFNYKYVKLPSTIGIMILSLGASFLLQFFEIFNLDISFAHNLISSIDFNETLMNGMLSFLLFAGALHIDINDLKKQKWVILTLATIGVLASTLLVGWCMYFILNNIGFEIPFIHCLLFGALISPTDPIAVLGILKQAGAPKTLETKIAGESLFNDGVGVVIFAVILNICLNESDVNINHAITLFFKEAFGGIVFGLIIGWFYYQLLKSVDNYSLEILLTLSLVMGAYSIAPYFHVSGPLAMVVSGLFIGNHGKLFAMSKATHKQLFSFWELIDEFLNAVLFVLIGLEVLVLAFGLNYILAGILAIPMVVIVRWICISVIVSLFKMQHQFSKGAISILTWGGLRGGISVALALSISPDITSRNLIIAITYIVVIFSIIIQGLTVKPMIKRNL